MLKSFCYCGCLLLWALAIVLFPSASETGHAEHNTQAQSNDSSLVVQGKVTDADGRPIASARVELSPDSIFPNLHSPTRAEVKTNRDGSFRFLNCLPGPNKIFVAASGLITQHREITIEPNMAAVDFRLSPGKSVKIRVVDQAGKPLAGAWVLPRLLFGNYQPLICDDVETDQDGRWESFNSPEGDIPLIIIKQGYATVYPRLAAGDAEHRIVLRPPVCIFGRVIDAVTKKPIANVSISSRFTELKHSPDCVTGPSEALDGAGGYKLSFEDEQGIDQVTWRIRVMAVGYVTQYSAEFMVRDGSRTIDFEMVPGKDVSGVVKRPDGSPAAFSRVFVATESEPCTVYTGYAREGAFTGKNGRFRFPRPLEPYVVGVVHPFGGAEIAADALDEKGEIVLLPWGRVEGVIHGPFDSQAGKLSVSLDVECIQSESTEKRKFIDWHYFANVDGSGRFSFSRVLPGRTEVIPFDDLYLYHVIEGEVFSIFQTQTVDVAAGKTTLVEFGGKGRAVIGRVVLPPDNKRKVAATTGFGGLVFQRPLKSVTGKTAGDSGQNVVFDIAADGTFRAENVAPGVYKMLIEMNEVPRKEKSDEVGQQIAWLVQEITVPETDDSSEEPIDLGDFTLTMELLYRGDAAPDFAFQAADGHTHRLADYHGRKVMLCYTKKWAASDWIGCGLDLKELCMTHSGGKEPLVFINLSGDTDAPPTVDITPDAEFQYIQGTLSQPKNVLKAYDIRHPDSFEQHWVLISAEGTVLREN